MRMCLFNGYLETVEQLIISYKYLANLGVSFTFHYITGTLL